MNRTSLFALCSLVAACAARPATRERSTPVDASGPLLGTPSVLSNQDPRDSSVSDTSTPHSAPDAAIADSAAPDAAFAAQSALEMAFHPSDAMRVALDRWCTDRVRFTEQRSAPPTHGYGIGDGAIARLRVIERRPPVQLAQPARSMLRGGGAPLADTVSAAIEHDFGRWRAPLEHCVNAALSNPRAPRSGRAFVALRVVFTDRGRTVTLARNEDQPSAPIERCVIDNANRAIASAPVDSAALQLEPRVLIRVVGVCESLVYPERYQDQRTESSR